jgi:DNA invertase Pin-like site-specific DNA recombinase
MARISKKVAKNTAVIKESCIKEEKIYKTAIYARISVEDSNTDDGTIENQILLVRKYIESKPYLKLCDTYIDNGYTGTNFDRESFHNLMEAIKHGKIDCIAVKDLSRFGRDYIETGNYLEKVFPFLGVRFISVNDNYDSHNPVQNCGDINSSNLAVILKNLINDIYSKDISKKCRTALETKQRKGEFIGSNAPYGYMKSPADKHKLVIDNETAPIVRDIFQWRIDGMSYKAIIRKLEELRILSPSNYLYSKGMLCHEKYAKKIMWHEKAIRDMLSNPVYIGHMAQGKEKSRFEHGLKSQRLPQDKWIIVENTHEALVSRDIFIEYTGIIFQT